MEPSFSVSQGGAVSAAVIDQLARTKGWTRFFSVLLWIGAVFLILGGIAMMFLGAFAGSLGGAGALNEQFAAIGGGIVFGAIYIVLSIVYVYPALKLGNFSSRVKDLMSVPNEANLIAALNEQRAFWKYVGVFFIIYFVFIVGAIVTVGIAGAAAAAKGG